ncbi:MAG: GntR family transcriptional regulator, phosphonate transport system regulatory protein, partial [Pseudonocardiales bacterium]|nr:GntR family transcriptional regulator, phosphonate transport system regulatory protein [Pseudonocardiales bacterium]
PPVEALRGLRLGAGVAAWRVESISRDADTGRVLLASTAWTRADAVRMVVELRDTPAAPDTTAEPDTPAAPATTAEPDATALPDTAAATDTTAAAGQPRAGSSGAG